MVAPIEIGAGIAVGGGVKVGQIGIYAGQTTTPSVQNVAGGDGAVGADRRARA